MFRAIFIVTCLMICPQSLLAQAEAGVATLSGVVLDPSGAAVPGAKVRVQSEEMGTRRYLETSETGLFTAVRLPAGRYEVVVEKNGFKSIRRVGLVLKVGAVLSYDVALEVGSSTETVNITAETPLIESTRSQTSTNVDERLVRDLPINGRNFLDFTILTPGVVKDPRTGDLAFAGQRGPSNSLLVDGMDANSSFWGQSVGRAGFRNPYSFSQDSVQEFQVNTNAYAAEFGRASGGVVNVLTKSGTNQLHGTGFWFFRDRAMNANTFFNNRAGIVRQPYHFNQFGGNLGGPVVKNRLFFFYNFDGQRNNSPIALFFPIAIPGDALSQQAGRELSRYLTPYSIGQNNNIHTAKIDWNASAQRSFSFRYNAHRFTGVNYESPGAQSSVDHTGDTILNTDNITATHTWVLGGNKVIDQRFVYLDERNPSTTNGDGAEIVVRQSGVTMMTFGNANFLPRFVNQKKYGVVQSFNWNVGSHSLKFGHDFKFERAQQLNSNLFFGQYTFDSMADFTQRRPSSFAQAFPGAGTSGGNTFPNADEYAFFAQDAWRVSQRLTLHLGGRYDAFLYEGNQIRNQDANLARSGFQTGVMPRDWNNVAGRFGFAYRLDRSGNHVIRGGAGMFYGRLPGLVARTIQAQNGLQVKTLTLTGAAMPTYPATFPSAPNVSGAVPDIFVMQPDFSDPLTYQYSVNVESRLARDLAVTVGYLGVNGVGLSRIRDVNQSGTETVQARFADGTPIAVTRRPGTTSPIRPNPAFGRISMIESGAESTYHAGFVQVTKRYAAGLQFLASYTLAKVIDTNPDITSFIPNSGGEDVKLVNDTLNPDGDRGLGDANVKHRLVTSVVWDIPFAKGLNPVLRTVLDGWQLSGILSVQSGRSFSARSNVDLNNDGNRFSDRMAGYGRGTIEGPGLATMDLRVSKSIRIWKDSVTLRLVGEAFNAFNRANFTTFNQVPFNYNATTRVFTPNPTFLSRTNTGDPRILQIAARITF